LTAVGIVIGGFIGAVLGFLCRMFVLVVFLPNIPSFSVVLTRTLIPVSTLDLVRLLVLVLPFTLLGVGTWNCLLPEAGSLVPRHNGTALRMMTREWLSGQTKSFSRNELSPSNREEENKAADYEDDITLVWASSHS
jgi:hypothetical protein